MITLLTLLPILGGLLVLVFGRSREMARLIAALFGFTGLHAVAAVLVRA